MGDVLMLLADDVDLEPEETAVGRTGMRLPTGIFAPWIGDVRFVGNKLGAMAVSMGCGVLRED